ncbi:unnamed protein product [Dovyalis caffra]|uniref:Uncharacterized protein n=1 Tax=Dovyalis caffra TaxID=77055 RepID=A0AAV1RXW3_9ROSI|nr:unnamed protein product [Dovyalis caffra]
MDRDIKFGPIATNGFVLNYQSVEVFLSFSHQETGKTSSDHRYKALTKAGIRTFRDQDGIYRGGKSGIKSRRQ